MAASPPPGASPRPFWKKGEFIVTTIIALASIIVPILYSNFDAATPSLQVSTVSTVPLKTHEILGATDIEIFVGGKVVPSPYVTTLELLNNGSKPVAASDFHSPIIFSLDSDSQIVRAAVSSTSPSGIDAKLAVTKQTVSLAPLLLNPEDSLRVTIITNNAPPVFSVNARISGIKSIAIQDSPDKDQKWQRGAFSVALGIAAFGTYLLFLAIGGTNAVLDINRWVAFAIAAALFLVSVNLIIGGFAQFNLPLLQQVISMTVILLVAGVLFYIPISRGTTIVPR
jgi:hypothetical protein